MDEVAGDDPEGLPPPHYSGWRSVRFKAALPKPSPALTNLKAVAMRRKPPKLIYSPQMEKEGKCKPLPKPRKRKPKPVSNGRQ